MYVPYCQYLCALCGKPHVSGLYQVSESSSVSPLGNYRKDIIHCHVNSPIYMYFHPQDATGSFFFFQTECSDHPFHHHALSTRCKGPTLLFS